jgi:hypothetical protein
MKIKTQQGSPAPAAGPQPMDLTEEMHFVAARIRTGQAGPQFEPAKEATDLFCHLIAQGLLSVKMEAGMKASEQTRALDGLLRKQKLDLDAEDRQQALLDDRTRALEWCLSESKKFPQVVKLFKQAFAALKETGTQA